MEYYCVMVRTGEEEEFKKKAQKAFCGQACTAELYYFQRTLKTNQGKLYEKKNSQPGFSGSLGFVPAARHRLRRNHRLRRLR